jgi:hypothetical protein
VAITDKIREIAAKERKAQEALEAPAVDGEFREVGAAGQESPPVPSRSTPPVEDSGHSVKHRVTGRPDAPGTVAPQPAKKVKREPRRVEWR